jgi:hypothetical protein
MSSRRAEEKRRLDAVPASKLLELGNLDLRQIAELNHLETLLPPLVDSETNLDAKMDACYEIYAYDDKAAFGAADPIGRFAYTDETGVAERTASIASFVSRLASLRNRPALAARIERLRAAPSRPHQDPSDVQAALLEEHRHELEIDEMRSLERRPAALLLADRQRFLDAHLLSGFRSRFPNLGDLTATLRSVVRKEAVPKEVKDECADLTIWDLIEGLSSRLEFVDAPGELPSELFERALTLSELASLAERLKASRKVDIALPIGTLRAHLLPQRGNALAVLLEE